MQGTDPQWYNLLMSELTPEQLKEIEDIFTLADQRKAVTGVCVYIYSG